MFSQEDLNIAAIPSDVIRNIVRIGHESIEGMRLISPRWNSVAVEHLVDRKRLPTIKCLKWPMDSNGLANPILHISREHLNYFGVEKWAFGIYNDPDVSQCYIVHTADYMLEDPVNNNWFSNRLTRLFKRCSYIEKFDFDMNTYSHLDAHKIAMIKRAMGDVIIQEVSFLEELNREISPLLNLLRAISVKRVEIYSVDPRHLTLRPKKFVAFLSKAVHHVTTVKFSAMEQFNPAYWTRRQAHAHWTAVAADLGIKARINSRFKIEGDNEHEAAIIFTFTAL